LTNRHNIGDDTVYGTFSMTRIHWERINLKMNILCLPFGCPARRQKQLMLAGDHVLNAYCRRESCGHLSYCFVASPGRRQPSGVLEWSLRDQQSSQMPRSRQSPIANRQSPCKLARKAAAIQAALFGGKHGNNQSNLQQRASRDCREHKRLSCSYRGYHTFVL
jgi:hypothetical protein